MSSADPLATMRGQISDSWRRSSASGVAPDDDEAPITLPDDDLRSLRDEHPLAVALPLLEDVLGPAVRDSGALMAVGDADGQLLWVSGSSDVRRRAERIGFVAGSNWDERIVGTNAPGTALALDSAVQVDGEEHFRTAVRAWSCVATPIHDPHSGTRLGVLDVTGGTGLIVPHTMAMVRAAARMVEAELVVRGAGAPGVELPEADPAPLSLAALGRDEVLVSGSAVPGTLRLGARHSELLVLLADHPDGLTGEELAEAIYPGSAGPSTVRAEVNRLRAALGEAVLASRPYRLVPRVDADWLTVRARLAAGDPSGALQAYRGRLLPRSQAPGVLRLADELHWSLRRAVAASGRSELMSSWTAAPFGADDVELWRAQLPLLPTGSPLRTLARRRIEALDAELGAGTD